MLLQNKCELSHLHSVIWIFTTLDLWSWSWLQDHWDVNLSKNFRICTFGMNFRILSPCSGVMTFKIKQTDGWVRQVGDSVNSVKEMLQHLKKKWTKIKQPCLKVSRMLLFRTLQTALGRDGWSLLRIALMKQNKEMKRWLSHTLLWSKHGFKMATV